METQKSSKEAALEDLPKDELVIKCKRFLTLAQKMKQSKEECSEELKRSKENENHLQQQIDVFGNFLFQLQQKFKLQQVENTTSSIAEESFSQIYNAIENKNVEISALQETLQKLNEKISDFEEEISEKAGKIADFKQFYASLDEEKRSIEVNLKDVTAKLKTSEDNFAGVSKKLAEFQDKYLEEKKNHSALQCRLEKLEERSEKSSLDSREGLQPVVENKEMEAISEKLAEAHQTIQKLESNNREMQERCKNKDILRSQLNDANKNYEILKNQSETASNNYLEKFRELDIICSKTICDVDTIEKKLVEANNEISGLKSLLDKTIEEKTSLEETYANISNSDKEIFNEQINVLKKQLEAANDEVRKIANDRDQELEQLRIETERLQKLYNDSQESINNCEVDSNRITELNSEIVSLKEQLNKVHEDESELLQQSKVKIEQLQKQCCESKDQYDEVCAKLDVAVKQLEISRGEVEAANEKCAELEHQLEQSKIASEMLHKQCAEIDSLKKYLDNERAEKEESIQKGAAIEQLQNRFDDMSVKYDEVVNQFEIACKKYVELERQVEQSKIDNEQLQSQCAELDSLKRQLDNTRAEKEESIQKCGIVEKESILLKTTLEQLQNQLTESDSLNKQLDDARAEKNESIQKCATLEKESIQLKTAFEQLQKQCKELEKSNATHVADSNQVDNLNQVIESLNQQLEIVRQENRMADVKYAEMEQKLEQSKVVSESLEAIVNERCNEYDQFKHKIEGYDNLKLKLDSYDGLLVQLQRLWKDISNLKISHESLKSGVWNEIQTLQQSNNEVNENLTQGVSDFLHKLVDANAELLSEMNMMNQVLKERGELISKLEDDLANLRSGTSEFESKIKKLTERLEASQEESEKVKVQLETRDRTIRDMEEEIWRIRGQETGGDTLSTSTISRVEETARLTEIEDSFEDRYNKLKIVAIKLKRKVAELQGQVESEKNKLLVERGEFDAKVAQFQTQARALNALQADYDKLQDQHAADKKDLNELRKALDKAREECVATKKNSEEMKQDREKFKQEKATFDIIKKELTAQVQNLKKAVEKEQVKVKDFDKVREKYEQEIRAREKRLEEESERHRATVAMLESQRMEQKKHSLLSLEMADYEKTVADLSRKLEFKEEQAKELENNLTTQRDLSKSLQAQILALEARVSTEQHAADTAKLHTSGLQDSVLALRAELDAKLAVIADLERSAQQCKLEAETKGMEMAELTAEKSKMEERTREIHEGLSREIQSLEDRLSQQTDLVDRKDLELTELRKEFESYKVRAQSVLRQSQKELPSSRQKDIEEELQLLRNTSDSYRSKMEDAVRKSQVLQDENQSLSEEKNRLFQKVQELMSLQSELRASNAELQSAERRAKEEGEENSRLLRVQLDTLAQCYKKEIFELEAKHKAEEDAIRTALTNAETQLHLHVDGGHLGHRRVPSGGNQPNEPMSHKRQPSANFVPVKTERETLDVLMLEREACEGSESVDSAPLRLVPLDQLLASPNNSVADTAVLQERLEECDNRIQHLTDLLSDAESDAARLQQLNEVLKEEIRRKERNEAREQHSQNLEYLKNIVVKFATLPRGDERLRLVPVLNTILKFSPEEEARLSNAAKGGGDPKNWGSYLGGMWSTTQ